MEVCGIVCEYNPFHNGHLRHIAETKRLLGKSAAIVCVMSGNFVQRGEPAVFEKHARAEAAARCGADLVLELPLPWALASAERFARGAVSLLGAAGIVTHLSFGSECGDLQSLQDAAETLLRPELDALICREAGHGVSYARARQRAAEALTGAALPALSVPNDILGIEYLKAIRSQNLPITPLAVPRLGAVHDAMGVSDCSGLALRRKLEQGENAAEHIPEAAERVFRRETEQGRGPVFSQALEMALLSRLRMLSRADFAAIPDASEGLENRLYTFARTAPTAAQILAKAKTKRYAASRLRRMLWAAALGLQAADAEGAPPYLRVLAANGAGRALLAQMRKRASVPVLTKSAAVRGLGSAANRVFSLEAGAADLYALAFSPEQRRGDTEWRTAPLIVS